MFDTITNRFRFCAHVASTGPGHARPVPSGYHFAMVLHTSAKALNRTCKIVCRNSVSGFHISTLMQDHAHSSYPPLSTLHAYKMFSRASPGLFLTSLALVLSGIVPSLFSTNHATSVMASPHPQDVAVAALEPLFGRSHIPDSNLFARAGGISLAKRDPLGSCGAVGPFPGDVDPSVTVVCLPQRR